MVPGSGRARRGTGSDRWGELLVGGEIAGEAQGAELGFYFSHPLRAQPGDLFVVVADHAGRHQTAFYELVEDRRGEIHVLQRR